MADGLHAMITRHLWLVPAMSTHLIYGPTKARHDDHAPGVYETAGFTRTQADWALSTVVQFVLGAAIGQAAENAWRRRQGLNAANYDAQLRQARAQATEIAMRFTRLMLLATAMTARGEVHSIGKISLLYGSHRNSVLNVNCRSEPDFKGWVKPEEEAAHAVFGD
jgi:hypothetical protein